MKRTVHHNRIEYEEIIWSMGRRKPNRKIGPCVIWFNGRTEYNTLPDSKWVTHEEKYHNNTGISFISQNGYVCIPCLINGIDIKYRYF